MALIAETSIFLRYFGDDLVPDALTSALGKAPTKSTTKGEIITIKATGRTRVARSGSWLYSVERREPGDLDGQIKELFDALTADLSVWRALAAKYKPDLFVGLFLKESNEGIEISAECLDILSSRGVSLSLDIYGPTVEQAGVDTS
jgi:ribosomal protein L19